MPSIRVVTDGDHERTGREVGTDRKPIIHTTEDWIVDAMEHGMTSGATSLMVLIPAKIDDVPVLLAAETSLQCWMMASTILAAKYQDEVEKPGYAVLPEVAKAALRPRYAEAIRRALPGTTQEQALEVAEMMFDALAGDAPPELFEQP